eukprot:31160-Pelagococcus_subviridis.AAC.12
MRSNDASFASRPMTPSRAMPSRTASAAWSTAASMEAILPLEQRSRVFAVRVSLRRELWLFVQEPREARGGAAVVKRRRELHRRSRPGRARRVLSLRHELVAQLGELRKHGRDRVRHLLFFPLSLAVRGSRKRARHGGATRATARRAFKRVRGARTETIRAKRLKACVRRERVEA